MAKIKKLPPHEAQKIAAGEVVERPANVVKELVENAVDAGATQISIYLEEGGKQLIRIVDNGCGMSKEDAHLCFDQHATSKIKTVDDLETIATFGFRGEALASIAAVSTVTLTTKEKSSEDLSGTKLQLRAGETISEETVSCTAGTDICVENIFFNLPARQKFLKKKETESRHITQMLHAFCLDYLHIHFKFFQQGKEAFNCPPTQDIASRIAQLWDHHFSEQMIPVTTEEKKGVTISGVISNHQYFRYDRGNIFFFVNKRWIKNQDLSRALLRGYSNVLPPARYPAACIFIDIDPTQVDVNIHPRKEEVQFLHPRTITKLLQATVKTALEDHLSSQIKQPVSFAPEPAIQPFYSQPQPTTFATEVTQPKPFNFDASPFSESPEPQKHVPVQETISTNQAITPEVQKSYDIIGQYHKTYILIEKSDGLFLVDQHAAHERILYQLFSKRFEDVATVKLMFPEIVTISQEDMQTVTNHLNIFKKNGIQIEPFGENQLVVHATPVHIKNIQLDELICQVAGWVREFRELDESDFFKAINEKLHAQMACKAAVKAGDVLTMNQMEQLLVDLEKTENRLTCPHGRPTGWLLSLYEIEKRFKRKK